MTVMLELLAPFEGRLDLPCTEEEPELFFAESPADIELAKLVCGPCPVREQCLAGALRRREPHGVWGGQLFVAGEVVARKRPRGRPRKVQPAEEPLVAAAAGADQAA
mgnify:CR=1 FL=1